MRKVIIFQKVVLFLILTCLLTASLFGAPKDPPFPRNGHIPEGPTAMDLSVEMQGEKEIALRRWAAEFGPAAALMDALPGDKAEVGKEVVLTVSDSGLGVDYEETFVVVLLGAHGIILVEKAAYTNYDPQDDAYVFPNPNNPDRIEDRITTDQLAYMLGEFDNVIYPTNTSVFGESLPRGAEGQKVWILIHNIRDESYYNPEAESYIAGYFSASEDTENNKNMMHIDTNDWINRTGPDSERPFQYESTFAHEFQHLIHFDQDPDEPSWVDEGLADLAGYLCGYGHDAGHIAYYLVYHPIVSLTFWGSQLEDYGASYLFALYLYENYGKEAFISKLVREQANGIEGIEAVLSQNGRRVNFDDIFDRWSRAIYQDDSNRSNRKAGYETLDIGSEDTWGLTIEYALNSFWEIPPEEGSFSISSDWLGGIEPKPYTVHYFRYTNKKKALLTIDGDNFSGVLPYSGAKEWYSEAAAWAWRGIYKTFEIPATGATLNFFTNFEIEDNWDYGYVEVYDHTTDEWTTLEAPGISVTHIAHPQDNPNTPEEREPLTYEAEGKWFGFTGTSGGWIPITMDLSPFAGHTIDIHFRTWQDGAFTLQMMYVDDIAIPEIGFYDDVEEPVSTWTAEGWIITSGILLNDLEVTTFEVAKVQQERYPDTSKPLARIVKKINTMHIDPKTQTGSTRLGAAKKKKAPRFKVTIVTNHARHILPAHYDLMLIE